MTYACSMSLISAHFRYIIPVRRRKQRQHAGWIDRKDVSFCHFKWVALFCSVYNINTGRSTTAEVCLWLSILPVSPPMRSRWCIWYIHILIFKMTLGERFSWEVLSGRGPPGKLHGMNPGLHWPLPKADSHQKRLMTLKRVFTFPKVCKISGKHFYLHHFF